MGGGGQDRPCDAKFSENCPCLHNFTPIQLGLRQKMFSYRVCKSATKKSKQGLYRLTYVKKDIKSFLHFFQYSRFYFQPIMISKYICVYCVKIFLNNLPRRLTIDPKFVLVMFA